MAMYYYASKISAIACGTRSKQSALKKSRGQRDRDKFLNQTSKQFVNIKDLNFDKMEIHYTPKKVSSPIKSQLFESECTLITASYGNPEDQEDETPSLSSLISEKLQSPFRISDEVFYENGKIVSGKLEALLEVLVQDPGPALDKDFVFSFLLSSRLFIRPFDLLGKLLSSVPENADLLGPLVGVLGIWTNQFPYDFRDERIMSHVKHIVSRCASTGLEELVSKMLSALLKRLTDLERHEENLRASQTSETPIDSMQWPTPSQLAQILCRTERNLGKHVGPEEFLQCSNNVLLDKQTKAKWQMPLISSGPPGIQDPKKTCNLETHLEWWARLRLFVSNQIVQCNYIDERTRIVELWSGVAQYCLLVGNYNSASAILESLESPAIARLKLTWDKLSSTCQQLDCMQRHAEGCADLWSKQSVLLQRATLPPPPLIMLEPPNDDIGKAKLNDWVVMPVLSDIVKVALNAREDCLRRLPNGHINVAAFDRMAAIAGAFTKHMNEVKSPTSESGDEYQQFCRHMQLSTSLNESELMMASFDCEEPTQAESIMYDLS